MVDVAVPARFALTHLDVGELGQIPELLEALVAHLLSDDFFLEATLLKLADYFVELAH